jgi:hypothetical protein
VNRNQPGSWSFLVPVGTLAVLLLTLWWGAAAPAALARPGAPEQATATAVPTALPPVDTPTLPPTVLPPVTTPTAAPPAVGNVCPQILRRVPRQAIDAAVANPRSVHGYNQPRDAGKPLGPFNPPRLWLSIMAYSKPYHPFFNALEYKVGCP